MKAPITIDFETEAIKPRPEYPPKPVGVAIWEPGKQPRYMAWGHPTGNNCSWEEAKSALLTIWNGDRELLFQNAPFDLEVAERWFDLPYPPWHRVHDTMLLAFMVDPHAKTLSLKPTADKWLDMPPEEQDRLKDWILSHVPEAKQRKAQWGAHISKSPGGLCGKYAIGDVVRTRKLFDKFRPMVSQKAYDREREVQPILLRADQRGVPVAVGPLERDVWKFENTLKRIDIDIGTRLKDFEVDVDSTKQLAAALDKAGMIDTWEYTEKGNKRVAAKSLMRTCNDSKFVDLMGYRARLKTGLRTFGRSWLDRIHKGRLHTHWNQVVNEEGVKKYGARTGRLSSTPNFQNLPKIKPDPIQGFPALPHPREYFVPSEGHVLLGRDYSQQELRILAYFLGGPVAEAYRKNQRLDIHTYAQEMILDLFEMKLDRGAVKTLAFGLLYGMGLDALSRSLKVSKEEASNFRRAYIGVFPGFREMQRQTKLAGRIDTWGDRKYLTESPRTELREITVFGGGTQTKEVVTQTFEYKLINQQIQGSAADCTKQAIINADQALEESDFLLTVHDEFLLDCPKGAEKKEMARLNEAMADVDFRPIEMLSDGKIGMN